MDICTVLDIEARFQHITASIIRGSAIELASYVVNAADLKSITPSNDANMPMTPASSVDSRTVESDNIRYWSGDNNLTLNLKETVDIVFIHSL